MDLNQIATNELKNPIKINTKNPKILIIAPFDYNLEEYEVISKVNNLEEGLKNIEKLKPDLVFISSNFKLKTPINQPIIYILEEDEDINLIDYGFVFKNYTNKEIKFTIDIALKKYYDNLKLLENVEKNIKTKNNELIIEKTYSIIILSISIILILITLINFDLTIIQYIIFIPAIYMIIIAILSLFKQKEIKEFENPPFVSIFIPAHNEEYTIESTVRSIAKIDYPNYEIIVINDGSNDKTEDILFNLKKEFNHLKIITRNPPKSGKGKGFVLNDALILAKGEIIGVFDSDSKVEKNYLNKIIHYLNHPNVAGVQSRVRMYNKNYNYLTNMQDIEFSVFGTILKAKDNCGFNSLLGGNGQFTKKESIINAGKWDGFAVTEDLNLSVKIALNGESIRYCEDVSVYQEAVDKWSDYFKQRSRWAIGNLETLFIYFKKIIFSKMSITKKIGIIFHTGNFIIYFFIFIGFIGFILNCICWFILNLPTLFTMNGPIIIAIISTIGFFPSLTISLLKEKEKPLKFIKNFISYWIYCFNMIPLFFKTMLMMILRKNRKWSKTTHKGD